MPEHEMPNISSSKNFFLARFLKRTSRTKQFSPKMVEKLSEEYLASMQFTNGKDLNCTQALSNFETKRIRSAKQFNAPKVGGKTLGEIFQQTEDPDQRQIAQGITEALSLTEDYQAQSNQFTNIISEINRRAKIIPPNINPDIVASFLTEEKTRLVSEMKKQFNHEKVALSNLASTGEFKTDVINHLHVAESDYDSFIRGIQADLEKDQKQKLEAFEKAVNQQIIDLRQQGQMEKQRIAYIASIMKKDKKARKYLEQQTGVTNLKDNADALLSIKVEDMAAAGAVSLLSGRKVNFNQSTNEFVYQFPKNTLWNVIRNYRRENMAQDDMRSIAEAVKACGHDSIIMKVDHRDPKNAEEMARMAYQAARNAGFPPEKITIQTSSFNQKTGKKQARSVNIQELFDQHPKWKSQIEKNAEKLESKRQPQPAADRQKTAEYKEKVREFRESVNEAINAEVAPRI